MYEVLDHDPTHEDIRSFFQCFQEVLETRGLELEGITTDASPLYPEPIVTVSGNTKHQVCQFHVIMEVNRAILKAAAKIRREFKNKRPKVPRRRPSSNASKKAVRRKKRLQKKSTDLFEFRYLFVKHTLTSKEKTTLQHITRGFSQLRSLRSIMDEVYRLFDRRCRTETALEKLTSLRQRLRRFKSLEKALKKLFSPNLEKALTFLDDSLLPATSNTVERGNRRCRKMQKSWRGPGRGVGQNVVPS